MRTKFVFLALAIGITSACSQTEASLQYLTLSNSDAEIFRQVIQGGNAQKEWRKLNSADLVELDILIGQDKNEFDAILKSKGYQRVGGVSWGMPYSCTSDPCACSESKTINYVRTTDLTNSFETVSLQYGPRTFDGVCRSGLFDISSVEFYERT